MSAQITVAPHYKDMSAGLICQRASSILQHPASKGSSVTPSPAPVLAPIGQIFGHGGATAPDGWEHCDGLLVPIADSPDLYSVVGTAFGGDGISTFALPDLRGRLPMGAGAGAGLSEAGA